MADKVDLDALEGDWLEGRWPQRDALIAELRASRKVIEAIEEATRTHGIDPELRLMAIGLMARTLAEVERDG